MRIFVTGASGFIGSAVVTDLLKAGHGVLGLARSEASAKKIRDLGADVHQGDVEDLASLRKGVEISDGVCHLGFIHDFSKFEQNCEIDRRAIMAMGESLGTKPLIVTSGTALLSSLGRAAKESDSPTNTPNPRIASEQAAKALADKGLRVSIVRLAPTVHGEGEHGFVPMLIALAREKGVAAYIDDGTNKWPAIHRLDAARIYRLAVEKGLTGAHFHGAAEEGVPFKDIAASIGRHLNIPVTSVAREKAGEHFGWFSHFAAVDNPTSSQWTRATLGWEPTHATLLEDMDHAGYFE